jgi:hypothetical protein
MTWRTRQRRRLLWAGVLLGLVLVLLATSVLRAGLWAKDEVERLGSGGRRRDALAQ